MRTRTYCPSGARGTSERRFYKHTAPLGQGKWAWDLYKHTAPLGQGKWAWDLYKHTARLGQGKWAWDLYKHTARLGQGKWAWDLYKHTARLAILLTALLFPRNTRVTPLQVENAAS